MDEIKKNGLTIQVEYKNGAFKVYTMKDNPGRIDLYSSDFPDPMNENWD
ncbi:MAG: hypothetical protein V1648_03070 [Candidatus Aenigmatarchaeota archaeon]